MVKATSPLPGRQVPTLSSGKTTGNSFPLGAVGPLFTLERQGWHHGASKQGRLRGGEGDPLLDEQGVSANLGVNEFVWLFVFFVLFQVI